jgi:four helix bundle protein
MKHKQLMVYQRALVLVQEIRKTTRNVGMDFSTLDQITRSSLSITANIAEGAGRKSIKERCHFYGIASASAAETYSHFEVIAPERRIDPLKLQAWSRELEDIVRMLDGVIRFNMRTLAPEGTHRKTAPMPPPRETEATESGD